MRNRIQSLKHSPIEIRRYGSAGHLVVVLHGGPGAQGSLATLARDLSTSCRVVEPLQRRSGDVPLTVAQHVEDLREVIGTLEEPFHLVGHSWGAMLALTFAARHPADICQLVLIGCGTFDKRAREIYHKQMRRRQSRLASKSDNRERYAATNPLERDLLFQQLCEQSLRAQSTDLISKDLGLDGVDERGHHETWSDAVRLQEEGIHPAEFVRISAPVVMIHGADDPHPGRMIYDSLRPLLPRLSYHELKRCGHIPWLERHARDEFYKVVRSVLAP